jgi:hypothetical protein
MELSLQSIRYQLYTPIAEVRYQRILWKYWNLKHFGTNGTSGWTMGRNKSQYLYQHTSCGGKVSKNPLKIPWTCSKSYLLVRGVNGTSGKIMGRYESQCLYHTCCSRDMSISMPPNTIFCRFHFKRWFFYGDLVH